MEAIILAGGLGTRLRSMVHETPKSMALINGRPFLEYLLDHLIDNGVNRFIFSVGYKSDHIAQHFTNRYKNREIIYAVEETQLGTGGAMKNAMKFAESDNILVANGDSLFKADVRAQYELHLSNKADVTLALKPMKNFDRYGTVELDDNGRITKFLEKRPVEEGLMNGGLYIFNVESFQKRILPEKFSIEKDYFEALVNELNFYGFVTEGYFLDIGIPKDFLKAQYEINSLSKIGKDWALFLDRDGVINKKRDNDYVKSVDELEILPGALEAIESLSKIFGRIFIVTNQQGIGKGLMTEEDLSQVHNFLLEKIKQSGGNIDAVYHAPQLVSEASIMRKPNIGMALKAKDEFPEVDFSKSIMVGDSVSDLEFAERAKMISILIEGDEKKENGYSLGTLSDFNDLLTQILR